MNPRRLQSATIFSISGGDFLLSVLSVMASADYGETRVPSQGEGGCGSGRIWISPPLYRAETGPIFSIMKQPTHYSNGGGLILLLYHCIPKCIWIGLFLHGISYIQSPTVFESERDSDNTFCLSSRTGIFAASSALLMARPYDGCLRSYAITTPSNFRLTSLPFVRPIIRVSDVKKLGCTSKLRCQNGTA